MSMETGGACPMDGIVGFAEPARPVDAWSGEANDRPRGIAGRERIPGAGTLQSGLRMASRASPRRIMKWLFASGT